MISATEHDSSILERLVMSPDKAAAVLDLKFPQADVARMQDLMERNNQGSISPDEQGEMESYRRVGTFLGILQARARLYLDDVTVTS